MNIEKDLAKIQKALEAASAAVAKYSGKRIAAELKSGGDPVTAADIELDAVLKENLLDENDGWLSEETVDDRKRLEKSRVWVVDPLDGTREFVQGIDEWCISVALVQDGDAIAGGICNPATKELFLGSKQTGVTLNGQKVHISRKTDLAGACVLASRSEVARGQWLAFEDASFEVVAMGSVAYKLARVAAGLADATFTLVPKNEWDVAAGTALVEAAGGTVTDTNQKRRIFNRPNTLLPGLIAAPEQLYQELINLKQIAESASP